ncbi:MAG: hypothetical protein JWQ64_2730, partial [Subtercola sp.]|nr:hypothetical protein [Subtercola sp.]
EATEWAFTPAEGSGPARVDDWALQVDARLEDLAGNSVRGVFDRDLGRPDNDGIDAPMIVITPGSP